MIRLLLVAALLAALAASASAQPIFGPFDFNPAPLGSGAGDVSGPASSTDNAITRFDGVTGKILQNSLGTIADDGQLDLPKARISAGAALTISQNATAIAAQTPPGAGVLANFVAPTDTMGIVDIETFGTAAAANPTFLGYRSRGTATARAAVQANDALGVFGGGGYDGSNQSSVQSGMTSFASQTWSAGAAKGAFLQFFTTPDNTLVATESARILASGNWAIGGLVASDTTNSSKLAVQSGVTGTTILAVSTAAPGASSGGVFNARVEGVPSAANQRLGGMTIGGVSTGTTAVNGASILAYSSQAWSGTAAGSYLVFETTPDSTVTRTEVGRAMSNGNWALGGLLGSDPTNATKLTVKNSVAGAAIIAASTAAMSGSSGGAIQSRAEGTPSAVDQRLGAFFGSAITTGTTGVAGGGMSVFSSQAWGASAAGTYVSFEVTPDSSTTRGEKMRLTQSGSLVIGNAATPAATGVGFLLNLNSATTVPAPDIGTILQVAGTDGAVTRINLDAFGTGVSSAVTYRHARNTGASPSATQQNDIIGSNFAKGYGASQYNANAGAGFVMVATQNYTNANAGARLDLYSTADNTNIIALRGSVEQDGGLTWPRTVTGGSKGAGTINASGVQVKGSNVGLLSCANTAVNFNSANTDFAITCEMPAGFTRYIVNVVAISGASASLTTATGGLFTSTGGGGVAIVTGGSAITVSTAAENTNNNAQQLTVNNAATQSYTATPLYFRVATPQGSAATGTVTVQVRPIS